MSTDAPFETLLTDAEHACLDTNTARDLARSIARHAFSFRDRDCRAWALADFHIWAELAGEGPVLAFESDLQPMQTSMSQTAPETRETVPVPPVAGGQPQI